MNGAVAYIQHTKLIDLPLCCIYRIAGAMTGIVGVYSSESDVGLKNGVSAPYSFATAAISSSSVEQTIRSKHLLFIAASIDQAIIGLPLNCFIFLRGILL